MKKIVFLICISVLFNCTHDNESLDVLDNTLQHDKKSETKLMMFKTFEDFNKKIEEVSNLTNEELVPWLKQNNPESAYFFLDSENEEDLLNKLPIAYSAVFNKDKEIVIGDNIVWFDKGNLFEFRLKDRLKVDDLKLNNDLEPIGKIELLVQNADETSEVNMAQRVVLEDGGSLDGRYQNPFRAYNFRRCSGELVNFSPYLKYVHEIFTVRTFYGYSRHSKLYLRLKLEWKARRRWKSASEPRNMNLNLTIDAFLKYPNQYTPIQTIPSQTRTYLSDSYQCSNDVTILLKQSAYSYGISGGSGAQWHVDITGLISHELNGGYHRWDNYVNW